MPGLDPRLLIERLRTAASLPQAVAVTIVGAALYGAGLGAWHGPRMALYAAVKLPMVLLVTGAATLLFNVLATAVLGERLRPRVAARLTASALASAAGLLGSLAPVAVLLAVTTPPPSPAARLDHNLLYLLHTGLVGACGLVDTAALWRSLSAACRSRRGARVVFATWIGSLALVGGEVAWALRPFLGSVYEEVAFVRRDALDGNVYEFVWSDILPYLTGRDSGQESDDE
ncbi:MAG TPA: hypothetical protein VM617_04905 [Thermoanaerobaculia bacterium]|nr:hypothetical protein [Thermoanaerobaculia bacterium]